ncbi:MAG TPA: hypothetical protein VLZ12_15505 [Verrucomicrobiae bacterium]|nr:hypothetical protein [Verrucomicrobiae bacterium]
MKLILTSVYCLVVSVMPAFAATNTIQVFNLDFGTAPSTHIDPTINLGDTVQWVWASDGTPHSTTAAPNQLENWDSGLHTQPFTFSHTFNNVGTFGYFCSLHGFGAGCGNGGAMSGHIIVVLPGATADRITAITPEGTDIRVSWITGGLCKTNALQVATGAGDGSYTNNFTDIFLVTNTVDNLTNYLDVGGATNTPSRFYRVRLVP